MRSLFVRIFVSFWLAMTLIGTTFAIIYTTTIPESRIERYRFFQMQAVRSHGTDVKAALERGDVQAAESLRATLRARTHFESYLFRDGEQIFGDPAPEAVRVWATAKAPVSRTDDVEHVYAQPVGDGVVVVGLRPRRSRLIKYISPDTLPLRLVVLFIISGLICFALARYLTRRIRTLRTATQTLAAGDLSVRVASTLTDGRDEAAALGRDIDRMAARIQSLLEAQQRLLRDVSHELRSPLARLTVALELARRRAGDDAAPSLDRIERESDRLAELIGEVLTLARLDDGGPEPQRTRLELRELVEEIVQDADFEGGTTAAVVLAPGPVVPIDGVPELLRRAIENVVRNALSFTAEGTRVEVSVDRDGDHARVRVRDHGAGVPEESLTEIFSPFYRVGTARTRGTGGTGLGLAITARAIALHGGEVAAHHAEGGGLVVELRLPM